MTQLVHHTVKTPKEKIALSLEGTWAEHHVFALAQALEAYEFFGQCMVACDSKIDSAIAKLSGSESSGPKGGTPYKSGLSFDPRETLFKALGADPTVIDGIDDRTAITLLSELGTNLKRFPTEKHFVSYLRLAGHNAITGGRVKKGRTKHPPSASRAAMALKMGAQSLAVTETALGAFYRRLKARVGAPKAKTAVARKIAIRYYRLLVYGEAYEDPGAGAYDERFREKRVKWLAKQATRFGLSLVDSTAPGPAVEGGVFP
jgi:hypothetical protein